MGKESTGAVGEAGTGFGPAVESFRPLAVLPLGGMAPAVAPTEAARLCADDPNLGLRLMLGIGTGRLAKASKNGVGRAFPSPSADSLGETDLMPTIITGTIRPPFSCVFPSLFDPFSPFSAL